MQYKYWRKWRLTCDKFTVINKIIIYKNEYAVRKCLELMLNE